MSRLVGCLALSVVLLPWATTLSSPAAGQSLQCRVTKERFGNDLDSWLGAALQSDLRGGATGRFVARYLVRIDGRCLRSQGLERIEKVSIYFSNKSQTTAAKCKPAAAKSLFTILAGPTPAGRLFDVRELSRQEAQVKRSRFSSSVRIDRKNNDSPGQWSDYRLARPFDLEKGLDVVVGVELEQEAEECPLVLAPPTAPSFGESGSYLQLLRREVMDKEGNLSWEDHDCDRNRVPDAEEGFFFRMGERLCSVSSPTEFAQWKIRVKGNVS